MALVLLLIALFPDSLFAHVKWFTHFSYADRPVTLEEAITPVFLGLMALSIVVIAILAALEPKIVSHKLFKKVDSMLSVHSQHSLLVMRVGIGAVLLLSWQDNAMLVPELNIIYEWVGWYQFGLAFLLLFRKTTPIAGVGLMLLYIFGVVEFGLLHMLDYPLYLGAGYFLLSFCSGNPKVKASALPVLYLSVGFSLCWVALEKIIYPQWGLYVLYHQPQLSFGLDLGFFLVASAFVEFALGFLIITGLFQRPIALVISIVFLMTTLTFGKVEVIGHTPVHAALIVLLLEGRGSHAVFIGRFLRRPVLRIATISLMFAALFFLLLMPYAGAAWDTYQEHQHHLSMGRDNVEVGHLDEKPELHVNIVPDHHSGYNLELVTENFDFSPESASAEHKHGEGHAHLYLNNVKLARVYHSWHHLSELRPGKYELTVTLNSNDHRVYTIDGEPVKFVQTIEVE